MKQLIFILVSQHRFTIVILGLFDPKMFFFFLFAEIVFLLDVQYNTDLYWLNYVAGLKSGLLQFLLLDLNQYLYFVQFKMVKSFNII